MELLKPGPSANLNRRNIFPCWRGYPIDSPLNKPEQAKYSLSNKKKVNLRKMSKNYHLGSKPATGQNFSGKFFCTKFGKFKKFKNTILLLYFTSSMSLQKTEMSKKMNFRAQITGKKNL